MKFYAKPGHRLTLEEQALITSLAGVTKFTQKQKAALKAIVQRWGGWPGGGKSCYRNVVTVAQCPMFFNGEIEASTLLQCFGWWTYSTPALVAAHARSIDIEAGRFTVTISVDGDSGTVCSSFDSRDEQEAFLEALEAIDSTNYLHTVTDIAP